MQRQTEIIDLSDLPKDEILQRIKQILQQSYIQKFTLLLKRQVHQSKTQKKLQKKQNAIQKIKHRYSASSNNNNLLVEKDGNLMLMTHKLRPSGDVPGLKINSTFIRGPDKKFSRISSVKSRDAVSRMNESFYNFNGMKLQEIPKSLQLYYEGQYQLALIQFFDQEKQLKKKLTEYSSKPQHQSQYESTLSQYAKLMINIGNCYFCQKDYEKATKYYNKLQSLSTTQVDEKLIGQKYNNLGSCYAHKKQNQQSLKCFNEALKIYAKYPQLDSSNLMKNIGVIYFRTGMFASAETYFEQSINERKAKSPENQEALLTTYYKLGLCQKYTSKLEEATNNLLFALNISQKGYPLNNEILKQLAETYELQQRNSEALLYYEKLSDQYERKTLCQGQIYQKVAKIHQRQGNFSDHDKFMRLALSEYRKFSNERKMSELAGVKE